MGITRLRLARFGCKNRPFYRVVAIDSRKFRDDKPLEYVGTYDPMPYGPDAVKEVRLRIDRVKYWLSVGAQPSDRVAYLLWRSGMMPAPPLRFTPQQSVNKKTRREAAKAAKGFHTATDALLSASASMYSATKMTMSSFSGVNAMSGAFGRPGFVPGASSLLR